MKQSLLASLGLALACSACAVGPNYSAPTLSPGLTRQFVSTSPGVTAASTMEAKWWRIYDDPGIDALVEEALRANPDVRVATANLAAARALRDQAAAARLPTTSITGDATYGRNQRNVPGDVGDRLTALGGFSVGYELDLFGRVRRGVEAADADTGAALGDLAAARVLVAANVLDNYATACTTAAAIKTAQASVAIADKSVELSTTLQRAGSVGLLDVERAGSLAATTRAAVAPLEREHRAALLSLAVLLGRPPAEVPGEASRCVAAPHVRTPIPVGDGASLLRRRPDVAAAERRLAAATARIGVSTADLYPTIRLGGVVSGLGGVGPSNGLSFGVGPLVSFTVPNQSIARARIRQAEARTQAALATFDGTVLSALREVEQAIDGYAAEQRRRDALREAERRADRAYRLAATLQRYGSIGQLDLLVAQRTLFDATLERARADEAVATAQIALFKALGGGWEAADPRSDELNSREAPHAH